MENYNYKDYELRNIDKKEEQEDVFLLWKQCFLDTDEYMDFYFKWKLKDNKILALYDNISNDVRILETSLDAEQEIEQSTGRLSSMIHLNPYQLMFHQKQIPAHYIVGVATRTEDRKQGLMRFLLEKSLKDMYQEGEAFTYLMPAKEEIYLPFGFRYVYVQERMIKNGPFPHNAFEDSRCLLKLWEETSEEEKENSVIFANQLLADSKDVYVLRDVSYYERLTKEMQSAGGNVVLFYRKDFAADKRKTDQPAEQSASASKQNYLCEYRLVGICCFMKEEAAAEIIEMIAETEYSVDIVDCMENQFCEVDKITCCDSSFLQKECMLKRGYDRKTVPVIMARIVNLEQFILSFHICGTVSIIIQVKDPIIQENNGTFEWCIRDSGDSSFTATQKNPDITMDISELTEFLFGNERMKVDGIAMKFFEKINIKCETYINDIV